MDLRKFAHERLTPVAAWLDWFNQRHPWSHNDHFHRWILRHLPAQREEALDVGCGRGELLALLGDHFDHAHGTDLNAGMREAARARLVGHSNVSVNGYQLAELRGPYDLITMVAVLHHLDASPSLWHVERLLSPGGRLMVVGLARPESPLDWVWDSICAVTNPLIGLAKHPRPADRQADSRGFPVADPNETYADLRRIFRHQLPGSRLRRRIGFRYTATWTKPEPTRAGESKAGELGIRVQRPDRSVGILRA